VPSTPPTAAAVPKLLKETEVYVKYGLHEKALEHLRKIFAADPDNLEAYDKAKALALAMGRPQDAIASLAAIVRIGGEKNDPRADAARAELAGLDPAHPALQSGGAAPAQVHADLDDELIEEELADHDLDAHDVMAGHDDLVLDDGVKSAGMTERDARPIAVAALEIESAVAAKPAP